MEVESILINKTKVGQALHTPLSARAKAASGDATLGKHERDDMTKNKLEDLNQFTDFPEPGMKQVTDNVIRRANIDPSARIHRCATWSGLPIAASRGSATTCKRGLIRWRVWRARHGAPPRYTMLRDARPEGAAITGWPCRKARSATSCEVAGFNGVTFDTSPVGSLTAV
jgi:hypothetical protein